MTEERIPVHQLGEITVYDKDSAPVQLSRLWSEKHAVMVFVRHFG